LSASCTASRNHRWLALILLAAVFIIGVGQLASAIESIVKLLDSSRQMKQVSSAPSETPLGSPSLPKKSAADVLDAEPKSDLNLGGSTEPSLNRSTNSSAVSAADMKLIELLSQRKFGDILDRADTIYPGVGHRTRSLVYRLQGDLLSAERELDLKELHNSGYPDNIQEGYYRNWPTLRLQGETS